MKSRTAIFGLVLFACAAGAAEEGNVYLWVDKDGTPHYQDRPPEGTDPDTAKALTLRYKLTDAQAMAAAAKDKADREDVANLREKQQAEDADADKADRQKVAQERADNCKAAREKAEKYDTSHRLYRPGPDGTRVYLSDEEIDATRLKARQAVDEWCGK